MKVIDWPKEKIDNMGKTTPSIENIKKFLNLLDNPEKKIPPVIHITGTNGKGSTISFLENEVFLWKIYFGKKWI